MSTAIVAPQGMGGADRRSAAATNSRRRADAPHSGGARLNRRGRVVAGLGLTVLVAAAVLAVSGIFGVVSSTVASSSAHAATSSRSLDVEYITVEQGQTLWQIASDAAPDADPRETILQIEKLNDLPNAAIRAGERLAVPQY